MNAPSTDPVYFLLVDDLAENLLSLEALLRREGLILLKAQSGAEALELLLKHDVALALVDVQMPIMDGFELAELMRGTERTRRVPLIFLTAASDDIRRKFRGYEAGAVDFLHKPIEADILRSKAEVFFELYRQRQAVAKQRDEQKRLLEMNAQLLAQTQQYAQALEDADRRKDEFLATLAHELRNPLAPILSAVQVLSLVEPGDPDIPDIRSVIERQVHQMVRLVDDLLDVSRITRGRIELQLAPIDLADVVKTAVETSRPLMNAGQHTLYVDNSPEKLIVHGDIVRLTQAVANLLNNAAKYTSDEGKIWLRVEREQNVAVIRVKDTGIGIPDDMLTKVFELFTQVNQHRKRAQGGLGIGLTLVKRLVEMHEGSIEVMSEGEHKGAEFIVRLPLANPANHTQAPALEQQPGSQYQQKILVVDDNIDAANSLTTLLKIFGHDVQAVHDGDAAVKKIADWQPMVVLMDLGMPGMDGFEAATKIRQMPYGAEIVLIAVTGWGQEEDRQRTTAAGFDHHMVKPVDIMAIRELLSSLATPS